MLLVIAALAILVQRCRRIVEAALLFVGAHLAAWLLARGIAGFEGTALTPYFLLLAAAWLLAWRCVTVLSAMLKPTSRRWRTRARSARSRSIFGAWILIIWEAVTRGAGIPFILLPPPSAIGARIANSLPMLAADVNQTIFKAVLVGYVARLRRGLRRPRSWPTAFASCGAACCRSATWCRRCRSSASRRSW